METATNRKSPDLDSLNVPRKWTRVFLEECVDILDSRRVPVNSKDRLKRQGSIPYYGATGQVGWIDDYLFDEQLLLLGEDGALFFDKTKPISYIINGKSWVNNHAHVLRAISSLTSNKFLKFYLDQFDFAGLVSGTTRLKLNQSSMKRIKVKLPPVSEQHRIVAKLEKLLAKVDKCKERLDKIPGILKHFRQSVLAAACSG
ncbi:MAG: restriction endonuclease subunit S, partial [Desulfobacteraceae bacterium]